MERDRIITTREAGEYLAEVRRLDANDDEQAAVVAREAVRCILLTIATPCMSVETMRDAQQMARLALAIDGIGGGGQ